MSEKNVIAVMESVDEFCEGMKVDLVRTEGRIAIRALNEAGFNSTEVDLLQLLEWLANHREQTLLGEINEFFNCFDACNTFCIRGCSCSAED